MYIFIYLVFIKKLKLLINTNIWKLLFIEFNQNSVLHIYSALYSLSLVTSLFIFKNIGISISSAFLSVSKCTNGNLLPFFP